MRFILPFCSLLAVGIQAQELPKVELGEAEAYAIYDTDLLPASFHAERRQVLRDRMDANSVAVVFAGPVRNRSNDVDFEYHQDPDFYYLTGLNEPHAVLFVFKEARMVNDRHVKEVLLVQERNRLWEMWTGKRMGPEGSEHLLGLEYAANGHEFKEIEGLFDGISNIYARLPKNDVRDSERDEADLFSLVETFKDKVENAGLDIETRKLVDDLGAMREVKTDEELVLLRNAINITCQAQVELMKALEPGMKEFETEAIVEYIFKRNGAEYPGFPTIHGSGPNTCVLHYISNRRPILGSDLLLSDIGAEYHGYTADVTRTMPVGGTFTPEQKLIYELVLEAQNAGIAACQVGNDFSAAHRAATKVIANGLVELGLIEEEGQVRRYFMHGTSHYLGLDVHDAGTYGPLKANSVITVEPGIYIAEGSECDPKWWNIGVRIEDDILITESGPELLSAGAPRTIEEIEALMKESSTLAPVEKQ